MDERESDGKPPENTDGHGGSVSGEGEKVNDGWTEVWRQRPLYTKSTTNKDRWAHTTTFFISNVPKGVKSQELRQTFEVFGQVADAIVPFRPARSGSNFGFVRFKGVRDPSAFRSLMGKVRIQNALVGVHFPKYDREGRKILTSRPPASVAAGNMGTNNSNRSEKLKNPMPNFNTVASGGPFKDALMGSKASCSGSRKQVNIGFEISKEVCYMQGNSVVGKVKSLDQLNDVEEWLRRIEVFNTDVKYVGGLTVLINFYCKDDVANFLNDKRREILEVFDVIGIWDGQDIEFERLAWLKIQGLPIAVKVKTAIDRIGELFGKILHNTANSGWEKDLSYTRLCVLVKGNVGWIDEDVDVIWCGRLYQVRVSEIPRFWLPDFLTGGTSPTTNSETKPKENTVVGMDKSSDELEEGEIVVGIETSEKNSDVSTSQVGDTPVTNKSPTDENVTPVTTVSKDAHEEHTDSKEPPS
ncbi:hypothetical protein SSX86_017141 [Deinandra increscens subsp. villosa]|uniref:RRM domain-containing protein n=1 Tax=Deinandra increscens subsp. villosa TaxID=3103831 RepID=A0AAP0GVE5_9ASTR